MKNKNLVKNASNILSAIPGANAAANAVYGVGKTFKDLGPKKSLLGIGAVVAGVGATFVPPLMGAYGRAKAGTVTYEPGMQRMTRPLNRGVIDSMMKASGGDPQAFGEMAKSVAKTSNNIFSNMLDDYGVNGEFISAFYGMGGR